MEYLDLCEKLWADWKKGRLDPEPSQYVKQKFALDYLPEPYLTYGQGTDPLYFLATNPGALNDFQRRDLILKGQSAVVKNTALSYHELSAVLGNFYSSPDFRKPNSKSRIEKQFAIKDGLGKDSMITFESIPFHSPRFPNKDRFIRHIGPFIRIYTDALTRHLADKSVIYISGFNTRVSISKSEIGKSAWLMWIMKIIGLNLDSARLYPLASNGEKTTAALLVDKKPDGLFKAISLIHGSNNIPRDWPRMVEILKR